MDTTEEGVEFIMTLLLLLRTTPLLLPSGVTTALVGLDDRIELLICGSRTPRPSSARHLPSRMDRTRWAGAAAGRVSAAAVRPSGPYCGWTRWSAGDGRVRAVLLQRWRRWNAPSGIPVRPAIVSAVR